jgi:hypothetical protein
MMEPGWVEVKDATGNRADVRRPLNAARTPPRFASQVGCPARPIEARSCTPDSRTQMASGTWSPDRGAVTGSPGHLDVYRPGAKASDATRGADVRTPDWVVAKLLVVSTQEDTAVGIVTHATTEIERGDLFRTSADLSLR